MQDTFQWSDYFEEFLEKNRGEILTRQMAEQFKSSKSPKKEWEIVAFQARYCGDIYNLYPDGRFRTKGHEDKPGYSLKEMVADEDVIHSVRRLSDGEVFSVGDRIGSKMNRVVGRIKSFDQSGHILYENVSGTEHISQLENMGQALFMTVDGVEKFHGDTVWNVNDFWRLQEFCVDKEYADKISDGTLFSTREAAEAYVFENRPVLSLKDVKEVLGKTFRSDDAVEKFATLVKQKLNQ
jgi:hypothetical protein